MSNLAPSILGRYSAGGLAAWLVGAMGVVAPLAKFDLPDRQGMAKWKAAMHGGWVTAEVLQVPFVAADLDIRSAYVAIASLIGWWTYVTAAAIAEEDVTVEFLDFLGQPNLLELLYEPATWRSWGLTLVEIAPRGEWLPVVADEDGRHDHRPSRIAAAGLEDEIDAGEDDLGDQGVSRLRVRPLWSKVAIPVTWCDLPGTVLRTGQVPEGIVRATRLIPVGCQPGLRSAHLFGHDFSPRHDPAVALVRLRREAKQRGDDRLAAVLRVIVNALVYGNFARLDPVFVPKRRRGIDPNERPGPWCWPPLPAHVASGSRLLLTMAEAELRAHGIEVAARDTDGLTAVLDRAGR